MDRKSLKAKAKESLADSGRSPKIVTIIFLVSAVLIMILREVLSELVGNAGGGGNYLSDSLSGTSKSIVLMYGVAIVFQMLLVILCTGYTACALEFRDKNPVGPGTLLASFRMAGKVILTYLLMTLFLSLWSYAFTLPLSYLLVLDAQLETPLLGENGLMVVLVIYIGLVMLFTTYRYRTVFFLLMDNPGLSPRQALRQASAINRGHRMQLFVMDLSFVPWCLLSILTCGILLVWKLPYIITTYAHTYDWLLKEYAKKQLHLRQMQEKLINDRNGG